MGQAPALLANIGLSSKYLPGIKAIADLSESLVDEERSIITWIYIYIINAFL